MGAALYVCSTSPFAGKTAVCMGIARRLLENGLSFGYLKPLKVTNFLAGARQVDEDAELMSDLSGQQPDATLMSPVQIGLQDIEVILCVNDPGVEYARRLHDACWQIQQQHDVVLLEGGRSFSEGAVINLDSASIARELLVDVLVIVKYVTDLQIVDEALMAQNALGDALLGVVFNIVPDPKMHFVKNIVAPALLRRKIPVLAVLPQKEILRAITVKEMAKALLGDVLCAVENQGELVENLMVGAMNVDVALNYFRGKPNKAVFTGGDRLDIQLAALETSTRCLVLTGNLLPSPVILHRAREVGVPVISVKQDTLTAVEIIDRQFGKTRFHEEQKIREFDLLMRDHFDFKTLYSSLGLH